MDYTRNSIARGTSVTANPNSVKVNIPKTLKSNYKEINSHIIQDFSVTFLS